MRVTVATIAFPALAIAWDSVMPVNAVQDRCSVVAWRRGYFRGLFYFDSNGLIWRVVEATPRTQPSLVQRLLNSKLRVDLRLDSPEHANLDEIKGRLVQIIDQDPDDLYDQFVSHEELKSMIRRSTTAAEI